MANSQHRCVFVGNIPYDATEEQLIQICEEVGPVVNFRLVIDRETGKPKGYGFCEYKDEETALSARRNLHGYDINGRQLRVDFAENDKNNERSKEQGRGGPGNIPPQKQIGGPADPTLHQPVGLQDAMAASIVINGILGGGQTNSNLSQNGIRSQPIPGTDPLTLHLAKMSKSQLTEVLTDVKTMATQNKEQIRQLFLAHPQLSKAVLQAHIMLKTIPPQLLQMANARQLVGPQSAVQPVSGQNKVPLGYMTQPPSQPTSLVPPSQYATSSSSVLPQPRFQTPVPAQHQVLQHPTLAGNIQSLHPQVPASLSNQMGTTSMVGHSAQLVAPVQPSVPTHSLLQDNVFKPSSSSIGPSIINNTNKDPQHSLHNPAWGHKLDHHPNMSSSNGLFINNNNNNDQINHPPPKLMKMEDGKAASVIGSSQPANHVIKTQPTDPQKPNNELPAGVDLALLEQVLNLTPEQLSSLPPDQQQQVIQLQQMLRQSK